MDDEDGTDMIQLQDSQAHEQAPPTPEIADEPSSSYSDVETVPAYSIETPITVEGPEMHAVTETGSAPESSSRTSSSTRPSRMIVGRHIPAPRPGTFQQATRAAFIDTAGRPVYSGRTATGSVSPTSRAYIHAALHSPTGPVHLDAPDGDDDTEEQVPDRGAPTQATREGRSSNAPQYQQMVAAGQSIHPSESSTQIDNLIETMHQAQRAHTSRVVSPGERDTALTEAGSSNVVTQGTDADITAPPDENL